MPLVKEPIWFYHTQHLKFIGSTFPDLYMTTVLLETYMHMTASITFHNQFSMNFPVTLHAKHLDVRKPVIFPWFSLEESVVSIQWEKGVKGKLPCINMCQDIS